jgi:drug/metabolite transporter (DMT)-like permease
LDSVAPGTSRLSLVTALGAVWVLWGSVYLGIRLVVDEVDPFQAMAQRFSAAGLILALIVLARRGPRGLHVTARELRSMVVTGVLLLGIGNGLQALAQVKGLPSGVTALVVATVPTWAVLLRFATGERPAALTMLGVAVGFLGLVVLVALGHGTGGNIPMLGVILCIGSSISWTIGSWLQGRLPFPDDIVTIAAYQQGVAACCSVVLAFATREHFSIDYSTKGWLALAHLILLCSVVGFLAFAWLLTHVPLSLTTTHAYVNPVVAVGLGWLILSEPIGLPVVLGGSIVISSAVLVVTAERRAAGPPEDVEARVARDLLEQEDVFHPHRVVDPSDRPVMANPPPSPSPGAHEG